MYRTLSTNNMMYGYEDTLCLNQMSAEPLPDPKDHQHMTTEVYGSKRWLIVTAAIRALWTPYQEVCEYDTHPS